MSDSNLTTPVFYGTSDGERLILDDRDGFRRLIAALKDRDIEIRLQKRRRQRSSGQNRWFHGCVLPLICEAAGYDRSEMQEVKDALKLKFLKMSRPGVGIDSYRQLADSLEDKIREFANEAITAQDALYAILMQLRAIREEDDRDKLVLVRSTADLDTAEFTTFIEDCRRWAAETLHIDIPDPHEVDEYSTGPQPVRSQPRSARRPRDTAPPAIAAPEEE